MRQSHFNEQPLLLFGPIISWFFACSNEEKHVCYSPISMVYNDIYATSSSKVSQLVKAKQNNLDLKRDLLLVKMEK